MRKEVSGLLLGFCQRNMDLQILQLREDSLQMSRYITAPHVTPENWKKDPAQQQRPSFLPFYSAGHSDYHMKGGGRGLIIHLIE